MEIDYSIKYVCIVYTFCWRCCLAFIENDLDFYVVLIAVFIFLKNVQVYAFCIERMCVDYMNFTPSPTLRTWIVKRFNFACSLLMRHFNFQKISWAHTCAYTDRDVKQINWLTYFFLSFAFEFEEEEKHLYRLNFATPDWTRVIQTHFCTSSSASSSYYWCCHI